MHCHICCFGPLISSYSIGGEQGLSVKHSFRALWESGAYGSLIISIIVGAAIGLITDGLMRRSVGASIGNSAVCVAAIATALGMQGGDFLFFLNIFLYRSGIELPHILFKDQFRNHTAAETGNRRCNRRACRRGRRPPRCSSAPTLIKYISEIKL